MARRQRRRRRLSGTPPASGRRRLPFPLNLIWNVKAFYVTFIFVMIISLAAVGLAPGIGSTPQQTSAPIEQDLNPVEEETPTGLVTFSGPENTIDLSKAHEAVITTDRGEIVVALNPDAPQAANSFAYLSGQNFYDGLQFFWVLPGFDVQAGDPTCGSSGEFSCSGGGGPGYDLPVEPSEPSGKWTVIAPVTASGDRVHGSQFVVSLSEDAEFEGSVIGEVVDGRDILESLDERVPCFGSVSSESNPCLTEDELGEMPPALTIEDVQVRPA